MKSCHPPSPNLPWKSFTHQLQPGMLWGVTTVVMSPHKLLEQFQQVNFRCLPLLIVNCHIDLPDCIITEQYQGLGMANYALFPLASKLSFLQCNLRFDIARLNTLIMGYKLFMVEVGLYGNTMNYYYKRHLMRAVSNTWFKNIWELNLYFNVWLNFNDAFHLKPVRQGNKSLCLNFWALENLVRQNLFLWISQKCIKKSSTKLMLFYPMAKQSSQRFSPISLENLTFRHS